VSDRNHRDTKPPVRPDEDDRIAALIRLAGARPTAPADRTARVKQGVLDHWQETLGRRSHRRWIAAGVAAAAVLAVGIGLGLRREPVTIAGPPAAEVEAAVGTVLLTVPGGETSSVLRPGDPVPPDGELESDSLGRAAVRMASGHSVRLDVDTQVRVVSGGALALERGAVYIDSGAGAGRSPSPLEVSTPFGVLSDVGTQFEARLVDEALLVRVREGKVVVDGRAGALEVSVGDELELAEGRPPIRRSIAPFGPSWSWAVSLAPSMSIEGRSLEDFLGWVSRESGWTLRFADSELARSAADIVLNGSIEGLSLDDALASVLPTCRMTHRIGDGTLTIGPLADAGRLP
jgi:ferric-dicitrate binding protein FerR (iron transport regulator)